MVYALLTTVRQKQDMTRFDKNFAAVRQRMTSLSGPVDTARGVMPIASLIDRVNAAKGRYQPR